MVWKSLPFRAALAAFAIALVALAGVLASQYALSDSRFLAFEAVGGDPAAAASNDPFALAPDTGQAADQALLDVQLEKARRGLSAWVALSGVLTWLFALAWLIVARRAEQEVGGPDGQKGQAVAWTIFLATNLAGIGVLGTYVIREPDLHEKLNAAGLGGAFGLTGLVGLLGFWLATALSASRVMRASVPLGHVIPVK